MKKKGKNKGVLDGIMNTESSSKSKDTSHKSKSSKNQSSSKNTNGKSSADFNEKSDLSKYSIDKKAN